MNTCLHTNDWTSTTLHGDTKQILQRFNSKAKQKTTNHSFQALNRTLHTIRPSIQTKGCSDLTLYMPKCLQTTEHILQTYTLYRDHRIQTGLMKRSWMGSMRHIRIHTGGEQVKELKNFIFKWLRIGHAGPFWSSSYKFHSVIDIQMFRNSFCEIHRGGLFPCPDGWAYETYCSSSRRRRRKRWKMTGQ